MYVKYSSTHRRSGFGFVFPSKQRVILSHTVELQGELSGEIYFLLNEENLWPTTCKVFASLNQFIEFFVINDSVVSRRHKL